MRPNNRTIPAWLERYNTTMFDLESQLKRKLTLEECQALQPLIEQGQQETTEKYLDKLMRERYSTGFPSWELTKEQ